MSKFRIVEIGKLLTSPETLEALAIAVIVSHNEQTEKVTMLCERLDKVMIYVACIGLCTKVTEVILGGLSIISDFGNGDGDTITAKILRTLQPSVRRADTKQAKQELRIPGTIASERLQKTLIGKGETKLINRERGINVTTIINRRNYSLKVNRGKLSMIGLIAVRTFPNHSFTAITTAIG